MSDEHEDEAGNGRGRAEVLVLRLAALVGLILSGYVAVQVLRGSPDTIAGCGGADGGCAHVLQTKWSRWFGVPVGVPGALVYAALLASTIGVPRRWPTTTALASIAALSGLWFVALQAVVIDVVCVYCMVTHGAGLVAAGAAWAGWSRSVGTGARGGAARTAGLALAACLVLAAGQAVSDAPAGHAVRTVDVTGGGDAGPGVSFFGGKLRVDPGAFSVMGDPSAEHVMLEIFDYTCPACRRLSRHLTQAVERYPGQIAVIEVPCPIDSACNAHVPEGVTQRRMACPITRFALAVLITEPDKHRDIHSWLMRSLSGMRISFAKKRAEKLIGPAALEAALADPRIADRIDRAGFIFASMGAGKLPKLVVRDDVVIVGEVETAEDLFEVLEDELGVIAR